MPKSVKKDECVHDVRTNTFCARPKTALFPLNGAGFRQEAEFAKKAGSKRKIAGQGCCFCVRFSWKRFQYYLGGNT